MTGDVLRRRLLSIAHELQVLASIMPAVFDVDGCTVVEDKAGREWLCSLGDEAEALEELSDSIRTHRPPPPGECAGLKELDAAIAKVFSPERMQALCDQPRPEMAMIKRAGDDD